MSWPLRHQPRYLAASAQHRDRILGRTCWEQKPSCIAYEARVRLVAVVTLIQRSGGVAAICIKRPKKGVPRKLYAVLYIITTNAAHPFTFTRLCDSASERLNPRTLTCETSLPRLKWHHKRYGHHLQLTTACEPGIRFISALS